MSLYLDVAREIGKVYLGASPEHASLQEFGLQFLVDNQEDCVTYREQKRQTSPLFRVLLGFRGHIKVAAILCENCNVCDCVYCLIRVYEANDVYAGF